MSGETTGKPGAAGLRVAVADGVAWVTLDRPDVRNALDADLIAALTTTFRTVGVDPAVRAVVLAGAGKTFCAGADAGWMRRAATFTEAENRADAERFVDLLRAVDDCPCPVIGRVHGAALGGGSGLVACCDIVVAEAGALLGFTEVRLGIIPAMIGPFALAKVGVAAARRYFLTGERFPAETARAIGLVHEVVPTDALDATVDKILSELRQAAPGAVREAKRYLRAIVGQTRDAAHALAIPTIARLRAGPEGQEGLRAFLEKRPPRWP